MTTSSKLDDNATAMTQDIMEDVSNCIDWLLMTSYQYYINNKSILTDIMFDALVGQTKECWDDIEHPYKRYIDEENLETGSLFNLKAHVYPTILIKRSTKMLEGKPNVIKARRRVKELLP